MSRRTTVLALLAASSLGLAGCSSDGSGGASTAEGDAAACPGDVLDVVVSVDQWGDVVQALGGDCTTVTTVINSTAVDPHDYEPTTGDIAAFEGADLVVVNGADYDHWAEDAVANLDPTPVVVDAAEVVGVDEGAGVNPHLWYSPDHVQQTADAVTDALSDLSPDAGDYFADRATAWTQDLQPYTDELATIRGLAAGTSYAATETVFDYTAEAVGLTDATPAGYREAVSNESDPATGDVAAFESALADGSIDVLIVNTQTEGSIPDQIRDAAVAAGVPVVEVTESVPEDDGSFIEWQLSQLRQLADALGGGQ